MKAWSIIGLTAAVLATIPVSPQVTPVGAGLSVNQAQAATYRQYRRAYQPYDNYSDYQPIGGGGGQWYPN